MSSVNFYTDCPQDTIIKYAVIVARYHGKWILARHKERTTWEIPGGHVENNETPDQAALRELWEETGAVKAEISPVCLYAVQDYGMLYFAEVAELAPIPVNSEIREIGFFHDLPKELTYPHIQPALFEKVQNWLQDK